MTRCSSVVNRSRQRLARGARLRRLLAVIVDGCYGGSDEGPAVALPAASLGGEGGEGLCAGSCCVVRIRPLAQDAAARCGCLDGLEPSFASVGWAL